MKLLTNKMLIMSILNNFFLFFNLFFSRVFLDFILLSSSPPIRFFLRLWRLLTFATVSGFVCGRQAIKRFCLWLYTQHRPQSKSRPPPPFGYRVLLTSRSGKVRAAPSDGGKVGVAIPDYVVLM